MKRLLVTGFGPFEDVAVNASEHLAAALGGRPSGPSAQVIALALDTSFGRSRAEITGAVESAEREGRAFWFVMALGVARSATVRLERRARVEVTSARPDVDGERWAGRRLGERDLTSLLPLDEWARALQSGPVEVVVSDDCGGYVCNAVNHAVLSISPTAGLFVHVPSSALPGTVMFSDVLLVLERLLERVVGVSPDEAV